MSRISPSQHAYQAAASGGATLPGSNRQATSAATAVGIWFQVPKSRQVDSNTMTVAFWALQGEKTLVYATFQDSLPDFDILLAWLRQYRPPSVYWAFKNQGKQQNVQVSTAVIEWMETLVDRLTESNSLEEDNNNESHIEGAATLSMSVTALESNLFKDSHRTIPPLLQSLVEGNKAAEYALKANVDLAQTKSSSSSSASSSSPLCSALAVLWHGLGTPHSEDAANRGYVIQPAPRAPFLVLDRAASTSLNLWPLSHQGQAASQGVTTDKDSIYGLLSKPCETAGGKRLLKRWIQQPLTCLETLQQRQEAVAHLVTASVERESLKSVGLATLQIDLASLASKLAHYQECTTTDDANPDETSSSSFGSTRKALQTLYELYLVASQKIPAIADQVQQVAAVLSGGTEAQVLWKTWSTLLPQMASELQRSVALVEAVLDLDLAPREFLVQASYQPDLADLKEELEDIQLQVEEEHAKMNELWASAAGLSSESKDVRLEFDANDSNWQFRLPKTNDSKVLQSQLENKVTVHRLLKNGVYFSTKNLRQLSDQRRTVLASYDRLQRQVARDAVQVGATYHAVVGRLSRLVSQIDAVAALAHVSGKRPIYELFCNRLFEPNFPS